MREKEYLSIFLFILLIAFLILGGNYLIKLKPASTNNTSSTTKIDATPFIIPISPLMPLMQLAIYRQLPTFAKYLQHALLLYLY